MTTTLQATAIAEKEPDILPRQARGAPTFPGHPEGWFYIGYSDELKPGDVRSLRYFGQALILFRTESGVAQVLDAYCAHLGAHLGIGGKVSGENIVCPFHAWEYDVRGKCAHISYSDRIPKTAEVRTWPTVERSGLILVWHSETRRSPQWDPPEMPGYGEAEWTGYDLRHTYVLRTAAREIQENIADTAHFQFIHSHAQGSGSPKTEIAFNDHVMTAKLEIQIRGASTHVAECFGPGLTRNDSVGFGAKRYWTCTTPIDDETVEISWAMMTAKSTHDDPTGEIARKGVRAVLKEFEKDIPIWENKIFRARPTFCQGDGPIGRFRLWYHQFYPQAV